MRWEFSAEKILLKVVWKEERWQDVFALAHNKDSADHPAGPPVPAFEESAQPTLRMQRLCRLAHRAVVRPCIACFLVLLLQCVGGGRRNTEQQWKYSSNKFVACNCPYLHLKKQMQIRKESNKNMCGKQQASACRSKQEPYVGHRLACRS